jgi:tungstate transport system permease protein
MCASAHLRRLLAGRRFFILWSKPIDEILDGLAHAVQLILQGDAALMQIVSLSLRVSGLALLLATLTGVPLGVLLGLKRFLGRKLLMALLYTGMGFPPVVIGLVVYLLLSRSGPLGQLDWPLIPALFAPGAMVLAQSVIAFPLVAGFTMAAVMGVDPALRLQVLSLGATRWQAAWTILQEARLGVIAAIIVGMGSIISEVGAVMLVGGNIAGRTRVLTTAIVLETRKGAFDQAMALGIILLGLSFLINLALLYLQGRRIDE